jgi:methylated-DNA-protein-cysteine methyltransferase-like protein
MGNENNFCRKKLLKIKDKVYEFVMSIPQGKVATYGQIALHLGNRNFARVVGNILHGNPDPEHIPCHRVVNAQGRLSRAYAFGGIEAQRRLLESEGVVFKNTQVVDLSVSQMILEKS